MNNPFYKILFLILVLMFHYPVFAGENSPKLYINEFMASNSNTVESRDLYEYSDWIEIHNAEDSTVEIGGYYLTDDLTDPYKWQIPSGIKIRGGKRALFWADGEGVGYHCNFKLSAAG